MTKKLKCTILGDWSYVNEDRYNKLIAKYGSEEELKANYQSRAGIKLVKENEGSIKKATVQAKKEIGSAPTGKIACTVTGELMVISNARMAKKMAKLECDEQGVRDSYVSRSVTRQRAIGKTDPEIRRMYKEGTLPAPSAPKGSGQTTVIPKAEKPAKAEKVKSTKKTEILDITPTTAELDPLRKIDGEASNTRRNRIRKERRVQANA